MIDDQDEYKLTSKFFSRVVDLANAYEHYIPTLQKLIDTDIDYFNALINRQTPKIQPNEYNQIVQDQLKQYKQVEEINRDCQVLMRRS